MKPLPSYAHGPFDATPHRDAIGTRVAFQVDGSILFGRIKDIQGRTISIALEKRWGHRHTVALNWQHVFIADSQETPPPAPPRPAVDPERIALLQAKLRDTLPPHLDDNDKGEMERSALRLFEAVQEHLRVLDVTRQRVFTLITEYNDHRERCSAMGIRTIPPPIDIIRDIEVRTPRPDRKRHLSSVRDTSRTLLTALLLAAGEEGVTSEEIVATLCTGVVTPHRIMGTLSAFSRAKQAVLQLNGRWKAQ